MPSKESEAVRRHWAAARTAFEQGTSERDQELDDHQWAGLTTEPPDVDYLSVQGRPAVWIVPHAMPFSPAVDFEASGASYDANRERDAFFDRDLVRGLASLFLGTDGSPDDPFVNPTYGDLTRLGPIYIQVGGDEVLLDDAQLLAAAAEKAGVEVRLDVFPEMQHTFQMAAGRAPEADDAIERMARWARPVLGL